MNDDDFELTADETLHLLNGVGRVPRQPVGPHLDGEDMFDLTRGLMSDNRRRVALVHIESCPSCAEDAISLADAHGRERTVVAAAVVATAYAIEVEQRLKAAATLASLWMLARKHAICIARSQRLRATRSLQTRSEWRWFEENPKLFCAIRESAAGRTFALRSIDRAWAGKPIRCKISRIAEGDTLVPWAEVWMILPVRANTDLTEFIGIARLNADGPTPEEWRADVELCEPDPRQVPDIGLLRQAIDQAGREVDREAWRDWVAGEVAGGRLPEDVTPKLFPR
jgi:hypothetical protein